MRRRERSSPSAPACQPTGRDLFRDIHNREAVKVTQSHVHCAPVSRDHIRALFTAWSPMELTKMYRLLPESKALCGALTGKVFTTFCWVTSTIISAVPVANRHGHVSALGSDRARIGAAGQFDLAEQLAKHFQGIQIDDGDVVSDAVPYIQSAVLSRNRVGKLHARARPVKIHEHLENPSRIPTLLFFKRSHFTP